MSNAKEIAILLLTSKPCRLALLRIGKNESGARLLNLLSGARRVFGSFEEAWTVARRSAYAGHDHPDYIQEHLDLSRQLRTSDYAVLYWFSRISPGDVRVFDFGGHIGNLFYSYYMYLKRDGSNVDWTVFDLPNTLEQGRKIAEARRPPELRFVDSVAEFTAGHILLVSGAFHYWERSIREFVDQFPERPKHIIINRTPVHDGCREFFTVQHKGSYAVPCLVRNANELVSAFAAEGFVLVDRWPAIELSLRMPLLPEYSIQHYSGFYFRDHRQR